MAKVMIILLARFLFFSLFIPPSSLTPFARERTKREKEEREENERDARNVAMIPEAMRGRRNGSKRRAIYYPIVWLRKLREWERERKRGRKRMEKDEGESRESFSLF